jgi:3-hydroxyisobutyrate dehydrogenase
MGEEMDTRIGVAGIGRMGAAIAARLMEAGYALTLWSRSADKMQALAQAGAAVAASPHALAQRTDIVITMLTDAAASESVYADASGLLAGEVIGKLFIDMSTVAAAATVGLAEKVRARGAAFVECPVGGTVGPARQGKLIGLMGATLEDAARARPVLEKLCRRIEHCGPVGAGATMKLAINLPLAISWQAYGEAFALCRDLGFEPARLLDLFADTSGGTNALKGRAPLIAAALAGRDSGPVNFDVDTARKDLRTMLAEAQARGVELPLIERTLACYDAASRDGNGSLDASHQSVYWSRRKQR